MPDDEPRPDRATLEGACAGRRFRLRPARPDDAPALVQHWDNPDVRRFLFDGRPVRPPVVEALLTELLACGPDDTAVGLWVLEIPDDPGAARANVPAAVAGTLALRRCSQPALAAVELVYSLDPALWGRGLVTAAGRLLIGHAFAELGVAAVAGAVDEGNDRSIAVLRRLGMTARPEATTAGALGAVRWWVTTRGE